MGQSQGADNWHCGIYFFAIGVNAAFPVDLPRRIAKLDWMAPSKHFMRLQKVGSAHAIAIFFPREHKEARHATDKYRNTQVMQKHLNGQE